MIEAANGGARDPQGQGMNYLMNRYSSHPATEIVSSELSMLLSPFDIKRLESYANNMLDYHVILDLLPTLATLYFKRRLIAPGSGESTTREGVARERTVKLSALQSAMLLAMGLQRKTIEEVAGEITLEPNQVLAQFTKIIKKMCTVLQEIQRSGVAGDMPQLGKLSVDDVGHHRGEVLERMEDELESAAKEIRQEFRAAAAEQALEQEEGSKNKTRQRELLNSLDLSQ